MQHSNKPIVCLLLISLLFGLLAGCNKNPTPISNTSKPASEDFIEPTKELTEAEIQAQKDFANSSARNDTDVGLRNIKIDTAERDLTKEQKMIIQYFDDDYLEVEEFEFLKRYPNIFTGVQVRVFGTVEKILGMDDTTYQFACTDYEGGYSMVVSASLSDTRFIEGDSLSIYGRYIGERQYDIDGETWILPTVEAYPKTHIYEMGVMYDFNLYSLDYIKTIATAIFGNDIEVRKPVIGDEGFPEGYNAEALNWHYVVELEDQSNAKFTKYLFSREAGFIRDMKSSENVSRSIEFSADFTHFFLFTYDISLETLTLEYYDNALNKVWKREFSETTNAQYDYTKNNIYLIANNELYIIDITTGEDTYSPLYVGERFDLRKTKDGILMISRNKSDAIMKADLEGNMIWKTNFPADISSSSIQFVGDKIIYGGLLEDDSWLPHYIVIDGTTGSILEDAISLSQ